MKKKILIIITMLIVISFIGFYLYVQRTLVSEVALSKVIGISKLSTPQRINNTNSKYSDDKWRIGWKIENGQIYYLKTTENCSVSMHCNTETIKMLLFNPDIETFKALNDIYAIDKNNVYVENIILKNVDISTFEVIKGYYAKDKERVYYSGDTLADDLHIIKGPTIIKEADPGSFKILPSEYSKDKNHVYVYAKMVKEADADTFISYEGPAKKDKNGSSYVAEDINYKYFYGERIGASSLKIN